MHDYDQYPTGDDKPAVGDDSFIPFPGIAGVTVVPSPRHPRFARLMQDNSRVVGRVFLTGPRKRSGAQILPNSEATVANGNGSVLYVPVQVGSEPGLYTVTVYMNCGGSATNTIVVE